MVAWVRILGFVHSHVEPIRYFRVSDVLWWLLRLAQQVVDCCCLPDQRAPALGATIRRSWRQSCNHRQWWATAGVGGREDGCWGCSLPLWVSCFSPCWCMFWRGSFEPGTRWLFVGAGLYLRSRALVLCLLLVGLWNPRGGWQSVQVNRLMWCWISLCTFFLAAM